MTTAGPSDDLESGATALRKATLRAEASARRDALSTDVRQAATRAIEARLVAMSALDTAHVVHCYYGIGSEVGTGELLRGLLLRGHRVVCPRVVRGGALEHYEVSDFDALVDGPMGLREPNPEQASPVDLAEVDVMLVPGLTFDLAGNRIGYGAGYYDRTLAILANHGRATTVGLAFDVQVVDELPREAHDRAVDLIATETRTIVTGTP